MMPGDLSLVHQEMCIVFRLTLSHVLKVIPDTALQLKQREIC